MWSDKVKSLMNQRNMSQKELSRKSGITESSISRYLGLSVKPRMDVILNIAKALNVSPEYLLEDTQVIQKPVDYIANAIIVARDGNELSAEDKNRLIALILGNDK